jgi:deoxyribodipyrimidine photolyase-related protein
MTIGIWLLGNQLSQQNSALISCQEQKKSTFIILIESQNYSKQRRYHQQKLILVWSAMRHFAQELKADNWQVTYAISSDFFTPLTNWINQHNITELRIVEPSDRPCKKLIKELSLSCKINFYPNHNFLWQPQEFRQWADRRKRLILEDFYREGRKKWQILMTEDNKPVGRKWNLDQENRQPPTKKINTPPTLFFSPDEITTEVISHVHNLDFPTYGKSDNFGWAVNRQQALSVLQHFINHRLNLFGKYQDAMVTGEKYMWHSLISPYLNLSLLQPLEVIKAVEKAYYEQNLPLNSVEGFIRQILGWREYMYGIYNYVAEDYVQSNWFNHTLPLPEFFWNSQQTDMNCLHQVLSQTEVTGYAHHIQRLMILSNFALIVGISPQELENWFHSVFIDAYDWVMQTNVLGMGQFADGGTLASKPYAASANYIKKMSNYCQGCVYNPQVRNSENACPFNYFYWDFLVRHQDKLKSQGRMNLVLKHLANISSTELKTIQNLAQKWIYQNIISTDGCNNI